MLKYPDAVTEALHRLDGVGFEHGPSFANHAPMAAEAMARLGYTDEVPAWVDRNLRSRRYHEAPQPRSRLRAEVEEEWRSALGDFGRVADWSAMFACELAELPWPAVLATWWPRLLPGMSGALTHGVIRTAHAVRALALAGVDDEPQRRELARGLGYWAARYAGGSRGPGGHRTPHQSAGDSALDTARNAEASLEDLIVAKAAFYLRQRPPFPVPLIHAITAPAAVRLVCEYLPASQRWPSYLAVQRCSDWIGRTFSGAGPQVVGAGSGPDGAHDDAAEPTPAGIVAVAVELGDEHAIKLAEVAVRSYAARPDERLLAAAALATRLIQENPV